MPFGIHGGVIGNKIKVGQKTFVYRPTHICKVF